MRMSFPRLLASLSIVIGIAMTLVACDITNTDVDDDTQTVNYFTVTADDTTAQYIDLSTGETVTDATSSSWDIAFLAGSQSIYLNGGVTATTEGSSGDAAVWYTGETDFDSVTSYASADFTGDFAQDVEVYVGYSEDGSDAAAQVLNQIVALNYVSGTGTSVDPYYNDYYTEYYSGGTSTAYSGSEAYYTYETGGLSVTDRVYIVRLADGSGYVKMQISEMSGDSSERTRVVYFENL